MESAPVQIYTDGSCSPNPGPGGWGAVLLFADSNKVVELHGTEHQSTNNRMELTAALRALEALENNNEIEILTDSRYLQLGVSEWLEKWKSNGWITSEGSPVKNKDLWQTFSVQLRRHTITWTWIKGHNKNDWNERADALAVAARQSLRISDAHFDSNGVHLYAGVTWKHQTAAGAWAVVLNYGPHFKIIGGTENNTTANRLYLHAVLEGIRSMKRIIPIYVYTRSGYLRDGIEMWIEAWRKRNWLTRDGAPVSNVDLWQQLASQKEKYPIQIVSSSSENPPCHLEEAKELAREFDE